MRIFNRMPIAASAIDAAKNIGASLNYGFDLPDNIVRGNLGGLINSSSFHGPSVGGFATMGGGMFLGAGLGAAAGGVIGGPEMALPGAAVGAAAGAVALPAAGLAARGAVSLGGAALNLGAAAIDASPAVFSGAGFLAMAGARYGIREGAELVGMAKSLVRWDLPSETLSKAYGEDAKNLLGKLTNTKGIKLTNPISGAIQGWKEAGQFTKGMAMGDKLALAKDKILGGAAGTIVNGQTVFWGSTLAAGLTAGFHEMNRIQMGQMDGTVRRATPRVPAYTQNAGATGDLVFAMNANRRG